ncbi:hypothetical protein FQN54_002313 [Arachnomyces sp. PD_36]|nr:hypothetical protein FQN54_002313 [Arachnomyces sp. PD_36]
MVLSLPIPSFSKTSSPLTNSSNSNNVASSARRGTLSAKTGSSAASMTAASSSSTLTEALRTNPFGISSRSSKTPLDIDLLAREAEEQRQEFQELNNSLATLARLFPDVKVEVFRELLVRFDGKSRLEVCVDQLLRYRTEWVRGRWNAPSSTNTHTPDAGGKDGQGDVPQQMMENIDPEERFRSEDYKIAVKTTLAQEFRPLSRSTIDAVLAEVNFSYTRARPTLRELSRKSWRSTFGNIFPFRKKKEKDEHPLMVWQRFAEGEVVPQLKSTGCQELDRELHDSLLAPLLALKKDEREEQDRKMAEELNENEAKAVDALYECDCCLADVTFEQISTCSSSAHIICFTCIQRTTHEALFGQGWGKSIVPEMSTLRCLAPLVDTACEGTLQPMVVKRAILAEKSGDETYSKFEDRLSSESLLKSQMKLIRCPFCSYAEVDTVYHPPAKGINWRFRRGNLVPTILMIIFLLDLIPLLIIPLLAILLLSPSTVTAILATSIRNLALNTRPQRFTCSNPSCRRVSCITCHKPWHDPHICHEPLLLSLRATVEAARTAAIKRTCPRCGLSFVKSSGCNKLTCVCGYSMCYLCRKALGPPLKDVTNNPVRRRPPGPRRPPNRHGPAPDRNQENPALPQDEPENAPPENRLGLDLDPGRMDYGDDRYAPEEPEEEYDEPEGYKHFCEHFRLNPGSRCTECSRCDLYRAEDEEAVARRAGEKAERDWRIREGMVGVRGLEDVQRLGSSNAGRTGVGKRTGAAVSGPLDWDWRRNGEWTYLTRDVWQEGRWKKEGQALVDWIVERVAEVVEE